MVRVGYLSVQVVQILLFISIHKTLASPAKVTGAARAPAQDVTDATVGCKRLL
jgi:hypothetical protein